MTVTELKSENLEIRISEEQEKIKIQWLGRSDARNPADVINPFLENILGKIKGKSIVIDYTNFEFMNSSTVPPIIRFIKSCSLIHMNTTILYNKSKEWQSASFRPLQTVCMVLKDVEVKGV